MAVRTDEINKLARCQRFRRTPQKRAGANLVFVSVTSGLAGLARPLKLLAGKEPPKSLKRLS
jgi:hypothetical protein